MNSNDIKILNELYERDIINFEELYEIKKKYIDKFNKENVGGTKDVRNTRINNRSNNTI